LQPSWFSPFLNKILPFSDICKPLQALYPKDAGSATDRLSARRTAIKRQKNTFHHPGAHYLYRESAQQKTQGRCPHTLSRGLTSPTERGKTAPLGSLRRTCAARGAFLPGVSVVRNGQFLEKR